MTNQTMSIFDRLVLLKQRAINIDGGEDGIIAEDQNNYEINYDRFLVAYRNIALEMMRKGDEDGAIALFSTYVLEKYPNRLPELVVELKESFKLLRPLTYELLKSLYEGEEQYSMLVTDIGLEDPNAVCVLLKIPDEEFDYYMFALDDYSASNIEYLLKEPELITGYLDMYNTLKNNTYYPYKEG